MSDLFSEIISAPLWLVILLGAVLYIVIIGTLKTLLRPAITSSFDPLYVTFVVFLGPGIIGFMLAPFLTHVLSQSFYVILTFIIFWLLIIRFSGKPKVIDFRDRMGIDFQAALLVLTMLIIVANVIVNMIIPGKIPLFTEGGGMGSRFEATQNSRLLTWLSFATANTAGLMYVLTQNFRIRKLAAIAVVLQILAGLLFASKGAILAIVLIFLNGLFVADVRNDRERYKKIRKNLIASIMIVVLLTPFYLSLIGFGGGSAAVGGLAVRVLGGFDQLIYASQFDLLRNHGFDSLLDSNIIEYQMMPFFKAFFSSQYDYSNVGQYVLEYVTGIRIDGPYTFPNSNLILESIFTSGKYFGALIFVAELGLFYWCRRLALSRPITPYTLILAQCMVLNPVNLFLSGQEWVTETILMLSTVIVAQILADIWRLVLQILSSSEDVADAKST